jgi:hypothetical protein
MGYMDYLLALSLHSGSGLLVEGEEVNTWVWIQDIHAGDSLYWCRECKKEEICKVTPDQCKCQKKKDDEK